MRCGAIQTRGNFPLPFNAPRCHSNKWQLSVAIQRAAVPFKQGATFRCHSDRRSVISNKGQLSVAMQFPSSKGQSSFKFEVVHLESRFRAR